MNPKNHEPTTEEEDPFVSDKYDGCFEDTAADWHRIADLTPAEFFEAASWVLLNFPDRGVEERKRIAKLRVLQFREERELVAWSIRQALAEAEHATPHE